MAVHTLLDVREVGSLVKPASHTDNDNIWRKALVSPSCKLHMYRWAKRPALGVDHNNMSSILNHDQVIKALPEVDILYALSLWL